MLERVASQSGSDWEGGRRAAAPIGSVATLLLASLTMKSSAAGRSRHLPATGQGGRQPARPGADLSGPGERLHLVQEVEVPPSQRLEVQAAPVHPHGDMPAGVRHVADDRCGQLDAVRQDRVAGSHRKARQRRQPHAAAHLPQEAGPDRLLDRGPVEGAHLEAALGPTARPCSRHSSTRSACNHGPALRKRFSSATVDSSASSASRAHTAVSRSEWPQPKRMRSSRVRNSFSAYLSFRNPFSASFRAATSRHPGGGNDITTSQFSCIAPSAGFVTMASHRYRKLGRVSINKLTLMGI